MTAGVFMLVSTILFAAMGGIVKSLSDYSFVQLAFIRCLVAALASLVIGPSTILGSNRRLLLLRGLTGTAGLLLYFWTLQKLPLAEAVTLQYLSPVFTLLLAPICLRHWPARRTWVSVGIAFAGVCLLEAGGVSLVWPMVAGVAGALLSAVSYLTVRSLSITEDPWVVVFYLGAVGTVITGPWALSNWQFAAAWTEVGKLSLMALLALGAQYCLTRAYQAGEVGRVAPLTYLTSVWALLGDFFIWRETVTFHGLTGVLVILGSTTLASLNYRSSRA